MKRCKKESRPQIPRETLSEGRRWHGLVEDAPEAERDVLWEEAPPACRETLLFFSMELDGEAQENDRAAAEAHCGSCPSCRRQVEALRSLERLQSADRRRCCRVAEWATPEAPPIVGSREVQRRAGTSVSEGADSGRIGIFPLRARVFSGVGLSSLRWLRWGWRGAAAVALLLLGRSWGENLRPLPSDVLSSDGALPALVTPARWVVAGGVPPKDRSLSEAPFAERLQAAREEIAEELRRTPPDWSRIRRLAELVGELRTDLELLALHMAYLDIVAGASPDGVAKRWHVLSDPSGLERDESF